MTSIVTHSVSQRLHEIESIEGKRVLWTAGCYPTTKAWLVFVGPSPGKGYDRKSGEREWFFSGWVNEVFNDPVEKWSRGFRISTKPIVEGITGLPFESSGRLFAYVNLEWNPYGREAEIPDEHLELGLPDVHRILKKLEPKLIMPMTRKVDGLLLRYFDTQVNAEFDISKEAEDDEIVIRRNPFQKNKGLDVRRFTRCDDKVFVGSLVIRLPYHPSRITDLNYAKRIASKVRKYVDRCLV